MSITSLLSLESLLLAASAYVVYKVVSGSLTSSLKTVPGPWHTLFSDLWYNSHLMQGVQLTRLEKLHRQYGSLVRIAPNMVSVGDVDAVRMIHSTHRFVKGPIYHGYKFAGADNIFSTNQPDFYKSRKRLIAPAFSATSINEMEPYVFNTGILGLVDRLNLHADGEQTVDMLKLFSFMTFDVMGEIMFGRSFDLLKEDNHPILGWIQSSLMLGIYKVALGDKLTQMLFPDNFKDERKLVDFALDSIRQRRGNQMRADSLQKLIDAEDDETGARLGESDLATESVVQMIAGTDTTSTTLTWALHFLMDHPECMEKLQAELDAALPDATAPFTHKDVRDLPYLNAVLNEALRIHPVGSGDAQRVVPPEGAHICGHFLPGGTIVVPQMYTLHRLDSHWSEPELFKPERWLGDADSMHTMKRAFIPFSMGARACIGRNLAWLELRTALAAVARQFNFERIPGLDMSPQHRFIVRPKANMLNVKVTRRVAA